MRRSILPMLCAGIVATAGTPIALAQTSVSYGRITAVNSVTVDSSGAQLGGALVGGTIGAVSGRNQSGSNQALRGVVGGATGRRVGGAMGRTNAFEYTILMGGTNTITMITDQTGVRVGDCVAVERGAFNNLRLVDDARCAARPAAAPAPKPPASAVRDADACSQAKATLLKAETDDEFDRAERRVRLLCGV